jgi:hypothetical protein
MLRIVTASSVKRSVGLKPRRLIWKIIFRMVGCVDASSREQAEAPAPPVSGKYERFPANTKGSVPFGTERSQETKCRLRITKQLPSEKFSTTKDLS